MGRRTLLKTLTSAAAALMILLAIQNHAMAVQAAAQAAAQPPAQPAAAPPVIRVAVLNNPPFAWRGPDGFHGLSVYAMEQIAAQNHWKLAFTLEQTQDDVTNAIISYQEDIGIGGLRPTPELGQIVDFSYAYQYVPLELVIKQEGAMAKFRDDLVRAGVILINWQVLVLFAVGLIAVLLAGYVIRLIERGRQGDMFPKEFRHNAWWAAQTMIAHNCGNKLPASERGRYIAIVLMLGGTVFTAQITALLTTNMAASLEADQPITGIGDIDNRLICVVDNSYAEEWSQENLMDMRRFPTAQECLAAVQRGDVSGAVFDKMAIPGILAQSHFTDLEMIGPEFGSHPHAFMLGKNSPYLGAVNQGLVSLLKSGKMQVLYAQFLNGTLQGGS